MTKYAGPLYAAVVAVGTALSVVLAIAGTPQ